MFYRNRVKLKFIGDRSGILGTILLPEENCGQKNGQKIDKNCAKSRCFCTFSVVVLLQNNYAGSRGGGARAPVPHSWRRQCLQTMSIKYCMPHLSDVRKPTTNRQRLGMSRRCAACCTTSCPTTNRESGALTFDTRAYFHYSCAAMHVASDS